MITLAFGQMAFFVATSLAPYGGDDGLTWPTRTLVLGTRVLKSETVVLLRHPRLPGRPPTCSPAGSSPRASVACCAASPTTRRACRRSALRPIPIGSRPTSWPGATCGLAGFLLGNQVEFVSPAYMHWQRSGELIMMVLLGGTRHALRPHPRRARLPAAGGEPLPPHRALEGDPGAAAGAGGAVRPGAASPARSSAGGDGELTLARLRAELDAARERGTALASSGAGSAAATASCCSTRACRWCGSASAQVAARWKRCNMAHRRALVSLVLLVDRGITGAVARWRRR